MNRNSKTTSLVVMRVFCILFGGSLMFVSGYGILHGILWVPQFSQRYGQQGIASLGIYLLFGALLFSIGLFARDTGEKSNRKRR